MSASPEAPQVTRQDSVPVEEAHGFRFDDGAVPAQALTYAPASLVRVGSATFVAVSGHTGTDADTADCELAQAVSLQTTAVLDKIQSVLRSIGGTMDDVTRVRVHVCAPLTKDVFEAIHDARRAYFTGTRKPASTLVRVAALVRPDALIEIDADAVITDESTSRETGTDQS
ncbi:RidA family protein [Nonomuraea longicatena]|uniref:RidA family protein n=1 Tax=Nonomuraea longicatena TaxID=83682 RepID=A0ABN1R5M9_9ACTN